jgi:serine/threonine protein kinase
VIVQLAAALDAAHAQGLVHRDVKPANVLLTRDLPEHVYLSDFGVAKQLGAGEDMSMAGRWVGTLDYLSPEQIRGERADALVDVYALGGVLYHCLTGEVPFPRENDAARLWAHVNAAPPLASRQRQEISPEVDEVIVRSMAKDPADRFATAGELARALARALGIELQDERPESSGTRGPRARTNRIGGMAPDQDPGSAGSTVVSD